MVSEQLTGQHAGAHPPAAEASCDPSVLRTGVEGADVGHLVEGPGVLGRPPVHDLGGGKLAARPGQQLLPLVGDVPGARSEVLTGDDQQPPRPVPGGAAQRAGVLLGGDEHPVRSELGLDRGGDHELAGDREPGEQQRPVEHRVVRRDHHVVGGDGRAVLGDELARGAFGEVDDA